jgi:hypothetical protein
MEDGPLEYVQQKMRQQDAVVTTTIPVRQVIVVVPYVRRERCLFHCHPNLALHMT